MNCPPSEAKVLAQGIASGTTSFDRVDIRIAPPFLAIPMVLEVLAHTNIAVGAQNVYFEQKGAYTGEISPVMLLELGARFSLVGHSERRKIFGESNSLSAQRAIGAASLGLEVVFCVGETLEERKGKRIEEVLAGQLTEYLTQVNHSHLLLAYEPVWAIGTGISATPEQVSETVLILKGIINDLSPTCSASILYGGSVTPENFLEILSLEGIDGALVGGASLSVEKFTELCRIANFYE